jgi:hypothetical protein
MCSFRKVNSNGFDTYNALELSSWLDIARIVEKYHTSSSWGSQELFWEDIEALAHELKV